MGEHCFLSSDQSKEPVAVRGTLVADSAIPVSDTGEAMGPTVTVHHVCVSVIL